MVFKKLPEKVKSKITGFLTANKILSVNEVNRLKKLHRFTATTTTFYGKEFQIVDPLTFLSSYQEIFKNDIYKFITNKTSPIIIDCGANIGLSTLYFKINHPQALIIAFEPDPQIFIALKKNIAAFDYKDIICKNEAVADKDTILDFRVEGGHSGMIVNDEKFENSVKVKATRLRSVLEKYDRITFLKIDIEGEEVNVLPDIADQLTKVDHLFLEYHSFMNREQQLPKLLTTITNAGMRYYIKEAANQHLPFINKELFLNMDMMVNIFCYR